MHELPLATRKCCVLHWAGLCSTSIGMTRADWHRRRQSREAFVFTLLDCTLTAHILNTMCVTERHSARDRSITSCDSHAHTKRQDAVKAKGASTRKRNECTPYAILKSRPSQGQGQTEGVTESHQIWRRALPLHQWAARSTGRPSLLPDACISDSRVLNQARMHSARAQVWPLPILHHLKSSGF